MQFGALSLHGVDLIELYQALIKNLQLGIGYAVPASYIPEYKDIKKLSKGNKKVKGKKNG